MVKGCNVSFSDLDINPYFVNIAITVYIQEKTSRNERVRYDKLKFNHVVYITQSFEENINESHDFIINRNNILCTNKNYGLQPYYPTNQINKTNMTKKPVQIFEERRALGRYPAKLYPIYDFDCWDYEDTDIIDYYEVPELLFIADDLTNLPRLFYQRARTVFLVNRVS